MGTTKQGTNRSRLFQFASLGALGIAGAIVAAIAMVSSQGALAASVTPVTFDAKNPTCDDIEGTLAGGQDWIGVSTGDTPTANQALNVGGGTVTITAIGGNPLLFNWTSTIGIDAVIVKNAASDHNVYVYAPNAASPESFGDTGLGSNVNSGSISHAVFCYDVSDPAVTNTPTNTPVTPADTATNTPTNTPETPTNTPTNTPTPSVTNVNQTQVIETPTNTPTPTDTPIPTATNTPGGPTVTPSNTPTNTPVTPTAETTSSSGNSVVNTPTNPPATSTGTSEAPAAPPSISIVEGEKTPGPTPQAPGTGNSRGFGEGFDLLVVVAGLAALSLGSWVVGTSKRG